jgi:hypothetical protein
MGYALCAMPFHIRLSYPGNGVGLKAHDAKLMAHSPQLIAQAPARQSVAAVQVGE